MDQLPKCEANYTPLTPITFLKRASAFYANRTSIIYEATRFTWGQTYERCRRLASSLRALNIVKNDVVSLFAFLVLIIIINSSYHRHIWFTFTVLQFTYSIYLDLCIGVCVGSQRSSHV
jgi:acyl-CoA synthetase (AMP-forming)/AMP-acid ligase II